MRRVWDVERRGDMLLTYRIQIRVVWRNTAVPIASHANVGDEMARDYFAEMYVAGLAADAGWNIYFPRRDKGFDYIITFEDSTGVLVRPVQVKGFYPTVSKLDKATYGYSGELSALHPEMVLVLVYFAPGTTEGTPQHIAFMPRGQIRPRSRGGFRCVPTKLQHGIVTPRQEFTRYFDQQGLEAIHHRDWI